MNALQWVGLVGIVLALLGGALLYYAMLIANAAMRGGR